jgi:hypothetical protein
MNLKWRPKLKRNVGIYVILLSILILIPASSYARPNILNHDAEYWNDISYYEQLIVVEGFLYGFMCALDIAEANGIPESEILRLGESELDQFSIGEIVDQLNDFYRNPANANIPLYRAIILRRIREEIYYDQEEQHLHEEERSNEAGSLGRESRSS